MLKVKHLYWYLTDENYRFIINNKFILCEGYQYSYERKYYECINSGTNVYIRKYGSLRNEVNIIILTRNEESTPTLMSQLG